MDLELAKIITEKVPCKKHHSFELNGDFLSNFEKYASDTVFLTNGMAKITYAPVLYSRSKMRDYVQIELNSSGADYTRNWGNTTGILSSRNEQDLIRNCFERYKTNFDVNNLFDCDYQQNIEHRALKSIEEVLLNTSDNVPLNAKANNFYINEHIRKLFMGSWVLASNYVEYRAPYWDYDLFEGLLNAPLSLLNFKRRIPKFIIGQNRPELTEIPMANFSLSTPFYGNKLSALFRYFKDVAGSYSRKYVYPISPNISKKVIFTRPYINYDEWMRNELRPFIEGVLLDNRTLSRGYYNVKSLRKMIFGHMSGKMDFSTTLALITSFELWHRLFMDSKPGVEL